MAAVSSSSDPCIWHPHGNEQCGDDFKFDQYCGQLLFPIEYQNVRQTHFIHQFNGSGGSLQHWIE